MADTPWMGTQGLQQVREGSAVDAVTRSKQRIADVEPELHAWVTMNDDAENRAARVDTSSDDDLPLAGVPVGVKDIIDVAGMPTRCGSPITSPDPVAESAPCVRRLEELGAIIMGKTVTTEFAYFKPGPTKNPWNPAHTPGGSSSGSAAAVASGMVPLALGTQTAASLIRPAAYCGIAGLVMGHGTADLGGIVGLSPSLDSLGLLTRSTDELRIAYHAFQGTDPVADAGTPRLLTWMGSDLADIDPAMRAAMASLPELLTEETLASFDLCDHVKTLAADHVTIMGYEASRTRAAELRDHPRELSAPLFELLDGGSRICDDDYWQATYRRDRSRADLAAALADAFVIGPAAPGPAPAGLDATGAPIMSRPWQALGFPTVAVPGLRTTSGLPLGLQIIGAPGSEGRLLALAARVERQLSVATPLEKE